MAGKKSGKRKIKLGKKEKKVVLQNSKKAIKKKITKMILPPNTGNFLTTITSSSF